MQMFVVCTVRAAYCKRISTQSKTRTVTVCPNINSAVIDCANMKRCGKYVEYHIQS